MVVLTSLNRPGANVTGNTVLTAELAPKRLQLVLDLIPDAALFGVLADPAFPAAQSIITDLRAAARTLGLQIVVANARTDSDLETAFAVAAVRAQRDGRVLWVGVTMSCSGNVPFVRAPLFEFVRGVTCFGLLLICLSYVACAQVPPGIVLDEVTASGTNYDKAEFRLWYPDNARFVRAVLVLVPGANTDGRPDVSDRLWQAFASRNEITLIGCHFTKHIRTFGGQRLPASDWHIVRSIVLERDGHACVYCGADKPLEGDHIVPLSRGGSNALTNLATACRPCNHAGRMARSSCGGGERLICRH